MHFKSKFPDMKTTIFSQISALANQHSAVNLGQGFPSFSPSSYLLERLSYYTNAGFNQYAPMSGMPKLLESVANLHSDVYGAELNSTAEITITSGATEALFCAISTVVNSGDEVIIFDPSYDSYAPNIELNGGKTIRLNLQEDFSFDFELIKKSINTKTKAIILNSPHNPSGKCLTKEELDTFWELIKDHNIYIISDEVYQHIIFDDKKHISPFNDERFRDRTFAISSFGKTFHVTGWKIGYCVANEQLTSEFRKIHQYITFSTLGSAQLALSDMMDNKREEVTGLSDFYAIKRKYFQEQLQKTKFKILPCEGSFFQLVDYSEISSLPDMDFCTSLIKEKSLAAIPMSSFYKSPPNSKIIRFCFAKDNETLSKAFDKF